MVQSGYGHELLAIKQNKESPRNLHVFTTRYNTITSHTNLKDQRMHTSAPPLPSAGSYCHAESISPPKSHGHVQIHDFARIPSV